MTLPDQPPFQAIALNAEKGAPEWVQLTPPGPIITGRDGRRWSLNTEAVLANFEARGSEFVIDVEHASARKAPKGEPALAAGWVRELDVRDGAIWARVAWNDEARGWIEAGQYRFISPEVIYHPRTRQIDFIKTAGLTNTPNFQMTALNSEDVEEENPQMDQSIREALGLNSEATTADALTAIAKLKSDKATALNSAQHPDPDKFVPVATHKTVVDRVEALEAADKERMETAINSEVDAAIEAGKVAPADRDFYVSACNTEGGLEKFRSAMEGRKPIVTPADPKKPALDVASALNSQEHYAAQQLGMSVEDYRAAKKEEA
ncbi:phage protease [Pseudaestuariivita sp.]|uniref:phage protease n=1 Tax=Pseudaestuariivita sp. TaxID=2211669 RepID=UPI004059D142